MTTDGSTGMEVLGLTCKEYDTHRQEQHKALLRMLLPIIGGSIRNVRSNRGEYNKGIR